MRTNLERFDRKLAEASANGTVSRAEVDALVGKAEQVIQQSQSPRVTTDAIVRRLESKTTSKLIGDPRAQRKVQNAVARFRSALDVQAAGLVAKEPVTLKQLKDGFLERLPGAHSEIEALFANRATLAALQAVDADGTSTASHISRLLESKAFVGEVMQAPQNHYVNGRCVVSKPIQLLPKDMALELLKRAGKHEVAKQGNCYGRTLNVIFNSFKPAEYARLTTQLALDGVTTLQSGVRVRWNPTKLPITSDVSDTLFGSMCNNLRFKRVRDPVVLAPKSGMAYQAQMSNLMTRLTGERWVAVQMGPPAESQEENNPHPYGSRRYVDWDKRAEAKMKAAETLLGERLERVKKDLAETGPWLAEYGCHGGSLMSFDKLLGEVKTYSFESGAGKRTMSGLGYVVMPKAVADKAGLRAIRFTIKEEENGYLEMASLPSAR